MNTKTKRQIKSSTEKRTNKRVCDRMTAVLADDDGKSYLEISRILLLDEQIVRRYVKDYFEQNSLSPKHKGSESFITLKGHTSNDLDFFKN